MSVGHHVTLSRLCTQHLKDIRREPYEEIVDRFEAEQIPYFTAGQQLAVPYNQELDALLQRIVQACAAMLYGGHELRQLTLLDDVQTLKGDCRCSA